jgi:3-oxoacyl-[acyl-carrier protein] reductase
MDSKSMLEDQVAIVTGGSRGIGKAICLSLAQVGAKVIACARDEAKLQAVAGEAEQSGCSGTIIAKALDVSQKDSIASLVEGVADEHGRIDILVNNAGITRDGLVMNMEDDQFEDVLTTNLRSVFWMTRAVSRHMVRARKGRMVNVSSVSGVAGNAGQANYAASKAGVIGFTKSVAKEFARRGITCNAVAPGFIVTDMTDALPEDLRNSVNMLVPMRRFGTAEEIAAVVRFLVGPTASYITGQTLIVDGGLHM